MLGKKLPNAGGRSLKPTAKRFRNDPRAVDPLLKEILGQVFDRMKEGRRSAKERYDFVFHLTDWVDDLRDFARLYLHPQKFTAKQAEQVVNQIFIHAIAHLKAARQLVMPDIRDAFDPPKVRRRCS